MNIDLKKDRILWGELFFRNFFRLLQTVKIHQAGNPLLLDCVKDFVEAILSRSEQDSLTLQISRNQFYLQEEKFICRTQNLTLIQEMLHYFLQRSIAGLQFRPSIREAPPGEIIAFANLLNQAEHREDPLKWLQDRLKEGNYSWVEIIAETDPGISGQSELGERARQNYSHAITSIQEVARKLNSQQRVGIHKAKRMVQNMVDLLSEDDSVLLGMSTIRDYDDYTYTHSVNVAILSMCLGKRIGLSRISLERIGICGLFHDIGKVEVPHDLINKPGKLTNKEYDRIKEHSIHSVRQIVKLNATRDLKSRVLLPPFEHHQKYDLSGYPKTNRKKPISLFGCIITVTDVFDAMTSPRIYRPAALSPDRVLAMMLEGAGTDYHPLILKLFIQMLGVYPVGSLLVLDTGEMGLVTSKREGAEVGRPKVVLLKDLGKGEFLKGEVVSLSEKDPRTGAFRRNISRSLHPSALGIQPSDFLV